MVKEAVALQLGKGAGKKKESGVEKREDMKKDKEKSSDKKAAFPGAAKPFGSKNEGAGTRKVTLEQLRGMVKEAIAIKLKEMGHEWGTEFEPGEQESLLGVSDAPEPVKSPEERNKAYNLAMGTDPGQEGSEARAMEDLEMAISQLGRLGVTKQGRAGLAARIKELEDMLSVAPAGRHFAGDRDEIGEASPAYTPPVARPQAAGKQAGGLAAVGRGIAGAPPAGAPGAVPGKDPLRR
jgi:hypothetical protein